MANRNQTRNSLSFATAKLPNSQLGWLEMEANHDTYLQLMYYIESRAAGKNVQYYMSVGLRNVGDHILRYPAIAVDVLVDNFSTTANAMDGHEWWTRSPYEWQPIGLSRTQKFHTWEDPKVLLYPGTERCIIRDMQFYTSDDTMGLRTARVDVFVYTSDYNGCAVLEISESDTIAMMQKIRQDSLSSASVTGILDLVPIEFSKYSTAPVAGVV